MSEGQNVVGRLAVAYGERPIVQALVEFLPGGGSLGALLVGRAEEIVRERLRTFFTELEAGSIELTEDIVQSDDFVHACLATVGAATRARRAVKIRLLARLLTGSATNGDLLASDEFEDLLTSLEDATPRELALLTLLDRYNQRLPEDATERELRDVRSGFYVHCRSIGLKSNDIPSALARLERTGLFMTSRMSRDERGNASLESTDRLGFGELSPAYHRLKSLVGELVLPNG